ncbi:hypothetical protein EDB87DRAFT_1681794 [Lactarius vividus]|nr:hypothetical protein EDB87DRAFT_1681794 [Lactarius vividus]
MNSDPIVLGLVEDSKKVYSQPLYAEPQVKATGRYHDCPCFNCAINELHNVSLKAKVHRYQAYAYEAERMKQWLHQLAATLGGVKGELAWKTPLLCRPTGEALTLPAPPQPALCRNQEEEYVSEAKDRPETPPPRGYQFNRGVHYIPFQIRDAQERLWPTWYTQLILTADPFVLAFRARNNQQYGKPVHTTPYFEGQSTPPTYTDDDLMFLLSDTGLVDLVDQVLLHMKDLPLIAEVHRYRCMTLSWRAQQHWVATEQMKLERIEIERNRCVARLQRAHAIDHIENKWSALHCGPQVEEDAKEMEVIRHMRSLGTNPLAVMCGQAGA